MLIVKPGTEIHRSGEPATYLYLIASGSMVFSRIPAANRPFTMGRHVAGDFHGLGPVLTQTHFIHYAVCREPTVLVRIPGTVLRDLVNHNGTLAFSLFSALEQRHLRARDLYVSAAVLSTRARIADLLRSLSLRINAGRYSADINLSQDEIAEMPGTRRQVINRVLRDMASAGDVQVNAISEVDGLPGELARDTGGRPRTPER